MKSENKSTTLHYYSMIEGIQGASPLIYIWGAGHPTMAIVNLLLLTNECQQRSSTDYALGVGHNTSHIRLINLKRTLRDLAGPKNSSWTDRPRKSGRFEIKRF